MLLRKKAVESLLLRKRNKVLREAKVRNTRRIDKRKYYGIKKNINEYQKIITNTLYQPDLIKQLIEQDTPGTEGLREVFSTYLSIISQQMEDEIPKIIALFDDTFVKGGRRVLNRNGEPIKPDVQLTEVTDNAALTVVKATQRTYIRNITEAQEKIILEEISQGITQGKPITEVSAGISSRVEGITKARANTIARTEMVKAHNVGQVETMKVVGASTYIYWNTGDKKVAPICEQNQGPRSNPNIYRLDIAGSPSAPLPVLQSHPNCRCTILIND